MISFLTRTDYIIDKKMKNILLFLQIKNEILIFPNPSQQKMKNKKIKYEFLLVTHNKTKEHLS